MLRWLILPVIVAPLAACNPHVVIEQTKPLDININFTGQLNLVIQDARNDLQQITGEKPTQTVRPEDIGLPAAPTQGGAAAPLESRLLAGGEARLYPVAYVPRTAESLAYQAASRDDLKKAMAARNRDIQTLWDEKAVGEAHTGLLVAKGTMTPEQQKLVDAENKDRSALYAAEAAAKTQSTGKAVTPEDVALAYYLARLGYAKPGNWYEIKNAATNQWEWKQWRQ